MKPASRPQRLRSSLRSLSLAGGEAPDPRFTLANERTFLAWMRTALALLGGGVAIEAFTIAVLDNAVRTLLASALIGLSAVLSLAACWRWWRVEHALRHQRPLPLSELVPVLTVALMVLALGCAIAFWGVA